MVSGLLTPGQDATRTGDHARRRRTRRLMQVTCTKCSEPIALSDVIDSNSGGAGAPRYDADRDRAAAAGEGGTPDPAAEDGRFVTGFEQESHSSNAACSQSFTRLS